MDLLDGRLHEFIKEELLRFGVQESQNEVKKSFFHHNGAKLLGFTSNYLIKTKSNNGYESPKSERNGALFLNDGSKTPKLENRSKSPFSKKNRMERRSGRKSKKQIKEKCEKAVFGCELELMSLSSAELCDGTLVFIPEFVILASNIIRQNSSIEGIFRKAGSTQRQNEMKKLLDSGYTLPTSVHPIDAACLLKQFLRSLPTPLLSHNIHYMMMRCLDLPKEDQLEPFTLCFLLLSKPHQDLLAFVLELMSQVASASQVNQMDAHNLAIVLAPNLIPSPTTTAAYPKKGSSPPEDTFLAATIDVIQALIEGAPEMRRLSEKLYAMLRSRALRSRSTDSLLDVPDSGSNVPASEVAPAAPTSASAGRKAKRRSASIHRLVNGLRRVVQVGVGGNSSHPRRSASPTPPSKDTPTTERGCVVSMTPDIDLTPLKKTVKRKSDEFESRPDRVEAPSNASSAGPSTTTVKKPRMELKVIQSEIFPPQKVLPRSPWEPLNRNSHAVKSMVTVGTGVNTSAATKQRRSLCDSRDTATLLPSPPLQHRRKSCTAAPVTPRRRSTPTRASSRLIEKGESKIGSNVGEKTSSKEHNLGPRGMPDGAESSPVDPFHQRKSPTQVVGSAEPSSATSEDPIDALEQRYDEIKVAVATMEREVDERNLQALREAYLSAHTPTMLGTGVSCSELIRDAYERMKADTLREQESNQSPSDLLSRRLGRELRIRRRRDDDHRVLRSPSERRIGTIRRRSKELELQQQQQSGTGSGCPSSARGFMDELAGLKATSTPRLKAQLLPQPSHSPQVASLRRGKPNSLWSGLPVVVNAPESVGVEVRTNPGNGGVLPQGKTVCISRRRLSSNNSPDSARGSIPVLTRKATRRTSATNFSPLITTPRASMAHSLSPSPSIRTASSSSFEDGKEYDLGEPPPFGCTLLLASSGKDLSGMDSSEWVPATEFLNGSRNSFRRMGSTPPRSVEGAGNRPSIAALSRQRKVTANVRLFSQLEDPLSSGGRQTPMRKQPLPNSRQRERSIAKRSFSDSSSPKKAGTPIPRQKNRRHSRCNLLDNGSSSPHILNVVSPLRERNSLLNIHTPTPKIKSVGSSKVRRADALKAPTNLTPLPPRPYKPPSLTPKTSFTPKTSSTSNAPPEDPPPMLPPRSLGFFR